MEENLYKRYRLLLCECPNCKCQHHCGLVCNNCNNCNQCTCEHCKEVPTQVN